MCLQPVQRQEFSPENSRGRRGPTPTKLPSDFHTCALALASPPYTHIQTIIISQSMATWLNKRITGNGHNLAIT